MRRALAVATLATLCAVAACSGSPTGGTAPTTGRTVAAPPTGWVVSLGDSYISGEGDRWAGNTNGTFTTVDALGPLAYAGPNGREDIPGCHRADLPEVAIDTGNLTGKNLACSGAKTSTTAGRGFFEPGIDFYAHGDRAGQALALERFARTHTVSAVVVSIGGNDFNFSTILTRCVVDFLVSVGTRPVYCSDDPELASYLTSAFAADVERRIDEALANVQLAMRRAGSTPADYRVIVQNYPSPLPPGTGLRYPETGFGRFSVGGCAIGDRDASWANMTVLTTINDTVRRAVKDSGQGNITLLDLSKAFVGHRLCERGAAQLEESGLSSWRAPGAADKLEWVNQVYLKGFPWQIAESAHPNYWGTGAERSCLRQVVAQTTPSSVGCVRDGTAVTGSEPQMKLVATDIGTR